MGFRSGAVIVLALSLFAVGCGGSDTDDGPSSGTGSTAASQPSRTPSPGAAASTNGLSVQVTGSCGDAGGFRLKSSGFTPNGQYRTDARYPDGRPYTYLLSGGKGRADADGATPGWTWNCMDGPGGQPDTPGVYSITITDLTTGKSVSTSLEVKYE